MVLKGELVVTAKIDGVGLAGSAGSIHNHLGVIQRQRCVLACTNCHPAPFHVGGGTDAVHYDVQVPKRQRFAPQCDTVFGKSECRHRFETICSLNCQRLAQVHALGSGICQQFNGGAIFRCLYGFVQRCVGGAANLSNRIFHKKGCKKGCIRCGGRRLCAGNSMIRTLRFTFVATNYSIGCGGFFRRFFRFGGNSGVGGVFPFGGRFFNSRNRCGSRGGGSSRSLGGLRVAGIRGGGRLFLIGGQGAGDGRFSAVIGRLFGAVGSCRCGGGGGCFFGDDGGFRDRRLGPDR